MPFIVTWGAKGVRVWRSCGHTVLLLKVIVLDIAVHKEFWIAVCTTFYSSPGLGNWLNTLLWPNLGQCIIWKSQ